MNYLIEKCYFNIGNVTMKQLIDIPMGINPAQFWANQFLYFYEEEYMYHHPFLLIKSRQAISIQESASLMIFAP